MFWAASIAERDPAPLLCPCEAHLVYSIQAWVTQQKKTVELWEPVQRRAMKMRGLEHSSMKTGMAAGLVQPREEKTSGRHHCGLRLLKGRL